MDLPAILALLADDPLGAGREDPTDIARYRAAFDRIDADPAQLLAIAEVAGRAVGTLQLTTDWARPDAHRFYDGLGFVPSHLGYKLTLI